MPLAAIKALCEHGADLKVRDHDGYSILHCAAVVAAELRNHTILEYILKTGKVDFNARDQKG